MASTSVATPQTTKKVESRIDTKDEIGAEIDGNIIAADKKTEVKTEVAKKVATKTESEATEAKPKIGDYVLLTKGRTGVIQFIGKTDFSDEEILGIELDYLNQRGHTGRGYFDAEPKRGIFIQPKSILRCFGKLANPNLIPSTRERFQTPPEITRQLTSVLSVGDWVQLRNHHFGQVKFIGMTRFVKGEVIGLELIKEIPNGHNGIVRGEKYFQAGQNRGFFARRSDITDVLTPDYKDVKIRCGDTVTLYTKERGLIRFMGHMDGIPGNVIGVELEKPKKNAHGGKGVFKCKRGHGAFVRQFQIKGLIKESKTEKKREEAHHGAESTRPVSKDSNSSLL